MSYCPTCLRPFARSNKQNAFLWGAAYRAIAEHTGHSEEEIHEWCKSQFLPKMFVVVNGLEIETRKSTTKLTVPEFADYVNRVLAFAGELGIVIQYIYQEPSI